jgi:metal-responsive CopG/Arc/MetJ family transcriptional regulator
MNGLSRETRLQIMLDENELAAIDDWRFKRRMPSRAAAIRDLLRLGLQAKHGDANDRSLRSEDFGVIGRDSGSET